MNNVSWVFDVDGVLCSTNQVADPKFLAWFDEWAIDKNIYFVTGSPRYKTIEQLGTKTVSIAKVLYNCLGNSVWVDDVEVHANHMTLTQDELDWLYNKVFESRFPKRCGGYINHRQGSVNFSIVGRGALLDERKEYIEYDQKHNERLNLVKELNATFPRLSSFLGGGISIDICLKGFDKGQVYEKIPGPIYFFGDKCYRYGIDEPLARKCVNLGDKVFQVSNAIETQKILTELCSISPIEV